MSIMDPTSIIEEVIQETVQMYGLIEADMGDNIIQLGKFSLYPDLSEDFALTHSYFWKVHLQGDNNKLLTKLQLYLSGYKGTSKVENVEYSLP